MSAEAGTWTENQRGMLFSLMKKGEVTKEQIENGLKFPMSELTKEDASELIDCFMHNGDLSIAVSKIREKHKEGTVKSSGTLDNVKDETKHPEHKATSDGTVIPKSREEAPLKKEAKAHDIASVSGKSRATDQKAAIVAFSDEKPFLPIDLVDIDKAVTLYEKFEYAKRKLAKPEDIQDAGNRKFYKKAFWRKAGTAFFVDYQIMDEPTIQNFGNEIVCTIKAVARWGNRTLTDVGVCSSKEFIGRRVFNYPDLISTAATRAINRVISDMIGGGEVTADEIQGEQA